MEKINLLVILGTGHKGSSSEKVADYIFSTAQKKEDFTATFFDIKNVNMSLTDDGLYKSDPEVSKILENADAYVFVVPEYNHGYPGSLKMFLDSYFDEYAHKAVAMVGVSSGNFGGARALIALSSVLRRVGMIVSTKDLYIGNAGEFFRDNKKIQEPEFTKRVDGFFNELLWLSQALKGSIK